MAACLGSPAGKPISLTRREKALVVAAAVAPDIDGLGIIPELLTRNTSHPLLWFSQYHHSLHTLAFALVCTIAAYIVAGPLARIGPLATAGQFLISLSAQPFESQKLQPNARQPKARQPTTRPLTHDSPLFWSSSASTCTCCATSSAPAAPTATSGPSLTSNPSPIPSNWLGTASGRSTPGRTLRSPGLFCWPHSGWPGNIAVRPWNWSQSANRALTAERCANASTPIQGIHSRGRKTAHLHSAPLFLKVF